MSPGQVGQYNIRSLQRLWQVLMRDYLALQEVGKENLFIFGMDESEVPAWREGKRAEWKDYDPRFVKAIDMIKSGTFGDEEYFEVSHSSALSSTASESF